MFNLGDWTNRLGKHQAFTVPIRGNGKALELGVWWLISEAFLYLSGMIHLIGRCLRGEVLRYSGGNTGVVHTFYLKWPANYGNHTSLYHITWKEDWIYTNVSWCVTLLSFGNKHDNNFYEFQLVHISKLYLQLMHCIWLTFPVLRQQL